MSKLVIDSYLGVTLDKGVLNEVSKSNENEIFSLIHSVSSLQSDFRVTVEGSDFLLERKDSNLYESDYSLVVTSILGNGSLCVDYVGSSNAVIGNFSMESINTAYDLLTVVDSAMSVPEGCVKVFLINNFEDFFKDEDMKEKLVSYISENGIYGIV